MAPAPFGRRRAAVLGVDELGAYRVLRVADDGPKPAPGQFAMLSAAERWGGAEDERPYLARAFSYARWLAGEAHFLLEDVGPGTRRLAELDAGEELWLLGPLGSAFAAPTDGRRALLVGGGVGIAPLAIWRDELSASGTEPTVLLGFRDAARAGGAALLRGTARTQGAALPHDVARAQGAAAPGDATVATDDGSVGHSGLVTELLAAELDGDGHAAVYACGPAPMLEAVRALCAERAVPAQLALEAGMACGFGACHGCVVPRRGGGYLRVCVDGPVIDAGELESVEAHAGAPA
ncbi:MAG TPA: dihydroorotate dehydrogenase electron transfer subunit [Solirubrobacteraceae bacterium]|nr:dihydroorotate dehydrogenase electron transfer subunit [Solirubrobacteraceae bacterium]